MVLNNTFAAKYRHRITIKNPADDSTRDTFGRRIGVGSTVATVWAERQDWQGDETVANNREVGVVTTKWKIRYRADVASKMLIYEGSVQYEILSVLDFDGTKRELLISSRKVTNL